MTTKRHSASAVGYADNILVAGGTDDKSDDIDIVEVCNGHHWTKAQCLPKPYHDMKSTIFNGHWYLMGGWKQRKEVYYVSLNSLVVSSEKTVHVSSMWKRLTDVPHERSSPAVFGNRLIAVGGGEISIPNSSIHAYSPHTQSWLHVGDMPVELIYTCTAVLTTGELMVIGGWSWNDAKPYVYQSCVYQASLNGNESVTCKEHKSQHKATTNCIIVSRPPPACQIDYRLKFFII